ncbi:MAG: hypothetical protein GXO89_10125 [Chlorobi bacterium]|nr:hypothetical protein [Chlorobiota bacterium]
MKKTIRSLLMAVFVMLIVTNGRADEGLTSYYRVASLGVSLNDAIVQVKDALGTKGFEVIGEYHPGKNEKLYVVAYTRDDLQKTCLKVKDRGALASVLKIGFVVKDGKVDVSMLNPEYIFYAYLMDDADKYTTELKKVTIDAKDALKAVGTDFTPFGGKVETDDLKDYHYMMMMPYFNDPIELEEFGSFEEGLSTIRKNLNAKKGNTVKVYELVFKSQKIAVFGIGLLDAEEGEAHFLPIIGEDHVAAMPYEIILQGNEATMLHGKYRFAIHWPELTMSQFMKISNTPGDVEDMLEALTE